jgi:hypothetical protein
MANRRVNCYSVTVCHLIFVAVAAEVPPESHAPIDKNLCRFAAHLNANDALRNHKGG